MAKTKVYDLGKYEESLGHELLNVAKWLFWIIVILVTLMGALIGALLGGAEDGAACAAMGGIISFMAGGIIAHYYTLFVEAKGEMLLRVVRIQENLDYLCNVKEMELNAAFNRDNASDNQQN